MFDIKRTYSILSFDNKTSSYYLKSVYLFDSIYFMLILTVYIYSVA